MVVDLEKEIDSINKAYDSAVNDLSEKLREASIIKRVTYFALSENRILSSEELEKYYGEKLVKERYFISKRRSGDFEKFTLKLLNINTSKKIVTLNLHVTENNFETLEIEEKKSEHVYKMLIHVVIYIVKIVSEDECVV